MTDTPVHEVRLEVTRRVTFHVTNPRDVYSAIRTAETRLWDGDPADDEDMPSVEVTAVKVGDREIGFSTRYDWNGPTERGLHRMITTARVDDTQVAEHHDFETVIRLAEAALEDGGA